MLTNETKFDIIIKVGAESAGQTKWSLKTKQCNETKKINSFE